MPEQPNKPYDIRDIIGAVLDDRYLFEVQAEYAPNILIGFGRLNGRPVGIVANQPAHLAGCLDINASLKGARFVRFCDCFNHSHRDVRGRAGLSPGHDAGVRRHHQARGQAALRVLRGHGAEAHRDHAQGLWRGLLRHVVEAHPRRRELRVPDGGDRRDGAGGRGEHPLPARDGSRVGSGRAQGGEDARSTGTSSPTRMWPRSAATSTRSSSPGTPGRSSSRRWRSSPPSATRTRRRSTGTSRYDTARHRSRSPPAHRGRPEVLGGAHAQARAGEVARPPGAVHGIGRCTHGAPRDARRGGRPRLPRRSRVSGGVSVHARRPAHGLPRAALDHAAVCGLRLCSGDQQALPLPPRPGPERAQRGVRPADPDGV